MYVRQLFITIVLVSAFIVQSAAQTLCNGALTGRGGKRLLAGHVALFTPDGATAVQTVQISADGAYALTVPRPGFWVLRFTGVAYATHRLALYVQNTKPIILDVSLGSYQYLPGEPSLAVVGDFNHWSVVNAVPLKKGADGRFSADIPATNDTITFRIRGYRDGDGVEGLTDAAYVLNKEGSYDARISASGGFARVTVDPGVLDLSGARAVVTFVRAPARSTKVADAMRQLWDGQEAFQAKWDAEAMEREPPSGSPKDWGRLVDTLWQQEKAERDTLVRSVRALAFVSAALIWRQKNPELITKGMEHIAATSHAWVLNPNILSSAVQHTRWPTARREKYIQTAMRANPERAVRVSVLYSEFTTAFYAEKMDLARKYYNELTGTYGDTPLGKKTAKDFPPNVLR